MKHKQMVLGAGMPVKFGSVHATVFGGPFKEYIPKQRRLIGVKMAAEIDHPHEVSIPTHDFSIPREADMLAGLTWAVEAIFDGNDIYAGCMGGVGRTGLFMGCMAKLMIDTGDLLESDPVMYVRKHYKAHAIETEEQKEFVRNFDTRALKAVVQGLGRIQYVTQTVIEEKFVYLDRPFMECLKRSASKAMSRVFDKFR